MNQRRKFIQYSLAVTAGALLAPEFLFAKQKGSVVTVNGRISPGQLGFTLSHEHVLVDFIGAEETGKHRYNADEVFDIALPFLQEIYNKGCRTFIDCTPAYLGRDASVLKRLSKKTGLNILSNTGYYGAAREKFLPRHAYTETATQLAERWTNEWRKGIENTGIKPGFIKTGTDQGPLTDVQRKLIDAAAITHLATGLTIAVHTGDGRAAEEQLSILKSKGVRPEAKIWVHAQNEKDKAFHIRAAQEGGWVSFDGVNPESINENIDFLSHIKSSGLLNRVLVSHDSGWYNVGDPAGGNFRPYTAIFDQLIPELKKNGFSQEDIDAVFIVNPAKAFEVKVRAT